MKCRHCSAELTQPFIDLGSAPPSNAYLTKEMLRAPEKWYPLRVLVCSECWLVQTEDYAHYSELFSDNYAYFSSFSTTWLKHAECYVAAMVERFGLGRNSKVVEIASNDGYLLQFVKSLGIPCVGVEPTASTAQAARAKGLDVIEEFFCVEQARKLISSGHSADLIVANNVLAHVPDINDFVSAFSILLKPAGVATFEFPHLLKTVQKNQFDTIYHEHFSYLSLTTVRYIFERNGLTVFDVDELPTHGGSLRVYAQRSDTGQRTCCESVHSLIANEMRAGVTHESFYAEFQSKADYVKNSFLSFLIEAKTARKTVAAYGAAAKGNTLMNYAGVRRDLIKFVVDLNPEKQGKYMPGNRIAIVNGSVLTAEKPDYIVIFPWNIKHEIYNQLDCVRQWGGRIVTVVPQMEFL